jgi:hypothetical protein
MNKKIFIKTNNNYIYKIIAKFKVLINLFKILKIKLIKMVIKFKIFYILKKKNKIKTNIQTLHLMNNFNINNN